MSASQILYDPVTETYYDVVNLIHHICNMFQLKHGGDHDDCVSIGHTVFVDCYRTWVPGKAPFTSYLSTCLWRRLLEEKKRVLKIGYTVSIDSCGRDSESDRRIEIADNHPSFDLVEFAEDLRSDAQYVLSLVFHPPESLRATVDEKGGQARNYRSSIREHLRAMGWGVARIAEAFEEITKCL